MATAREDDRRVSARLGLTEAELDRLAHALGAPKTQEAFDQRLEALQELALREWVDWILSKRRFDSISSLERDRLLLIFGKVRTEAASTEALVEEFDITESRAVSLLSRRGIHFTPVPPTSGDQRERPPTMSRYGAGGTWTACSSSR